MGNGESDTLLKAIHFHNSETCSHISESNQLPAVHQPLCYFHVLLSVISQLFHEHCFVYQPESQWWLKVEVFFFFYIFYLLSILANKLFHRPGVYALTL